MKTKPHQISLTIVSGDNGWQIRETGDCARSTRFWVAETFPSLCSTLAEILHPEEIRPDEGSLDDGDANFWTKIASEGADEATPSEVVRRDTDLHGRPWARLSSLKVGSIVEVDGDFPCLARGVKRCVECDASGRLFIRCAEGQHFLDAQLDHKRRSDTLIGIYMAGAN